MKKCMLVVAVALVVLFPFVSANVWWDSDWHYRVGVDVSSDGVVREDWPIEYFVDLQMSFLVLGVVMILM